MLLPNTNWFWYTHENELRLDLGDTLTFVVPFALKNLVNLPTEKQLFSLEDTEHYVALAESLDNNGIPLTEGQLVQILLNATAALKFHKPVCMKSWLYKAQNTSGAHFQLAMLEASFDDNAELGQVVVLEQDDSCATCMLISDDFMISDRKALAKFEIIKVMNDRLIPFLADIPEYKRA
ncbi:MAG: cell division protein ZapC [Alteromonadaceae bacterium]|uniref:Cell division protein ZapC n=2 Tax=Paraglaciecola chathamensis TaxID=368405 RepID=A0A8H9ICZ9_9ALTE|nr:MULTISPECIES: cell division protein ZapC domain-containing protein [Paraglaciecola]MBN26174.1 cell division protein ZapC [Alteromonadaceae bacterium]GAC07544.1 hypothetical protein GAGA_4720 [Paraglaciecola agarilytica NO2]GGZ61733.1 cell division protein ZapC [Paraglaciecola oceanifecundans]|tara:strand:- start:37888 stop:38424 length:537 start_codon:yes stop_codon:yes gene_type:complete